MSNEGVPASVLEARQRLTSHFASYDTALPSHGAAWSDLWNKGSFLPWDKGAPNPALLDLLSQRRAEGDVGCPYVVGEKGVRRMKRALVPGCGRGVDVFALAEMGFDAVGLEVSEAAVGQCWAGWREWCEARKERDAREVSDAHHADSKRGRVGFVVGDFLGEVDAWKGNVIFEGDANTKETVEGFDLIYDYTFFCALRPIYRPAWALRMSQLLIQAPTSTLITLEFPTYKAPSSGGPPFAAPPSAYYAYLSFPGEEVEFDAEGHVICVESEEWIEKQRKAGKGKGIGTGFARFEHYKPERTHDAGLDEEGKVRDWVGLWRLRE